MNQNTNLNQNLEIKLNFKTIIILLLFIIGIYFLIPKLIDAQEAAKLIFKVNKFYLMVAVFCEFVSYIGAAWLLGIILSRLGYKILFWDRFRIGSIAAFAIHFFPVGSFGEGAIDFYFLRKRKVEAGSILLMLILRIIITYIAFFSLFLVALILVPTLQEVSTGAKLLIMTIFSLVFGGFIYLIYLYEHKEKFRKVWQKFLVPTNFFLKKFKQPILNPERSTEIFEDIYAGLGLFSQKKRTFVLAVLAGLVYWLGDIFCLFFVFLSFGYTIHFGGLLLGYSVSALAGMASFIPGGLGVTEGTMALILTGLGTPSTIALMSVLVFRFFSFWVWIPVGLYSFFSLKKGNK
ncbi:MAG: flippase-like domain-containing protein [Patescibacteria group bacterium]|nr:flippase-like domain-containing protein [Patescibacteria group bacterium]